MCLRDRQESMVKSRANADLAMKVRSFEEEMERLE